MSFSTIQLHKDCAKSRAGVRATWSGRERHWATCSAAARSLISRRHVRQMRSEYEDAARQTGGRPTVRLWLGQLMPLTLWTMLYVRTLVSSASLTWYPRKAHRAASVRW